MKEGRARRRVRGREGERGRERERGRKRGREEENGREGGTQGGDTEKKGDRHWSYFWCDEDVLHSECEAVQLKERSEEPAEGT